jgi:hypothetical protein
VAGPEAEFVAGGAMESDRVIIESDERMMWRLALPLYVVAAFIIIGSTINGAASGSSLIAIVLFSLVIINVATYIRAALWRRAFGRSKILDGEEGLIVLKRGKRISVAWNEVEMISLWRGAIFPELSHGGNVTSIFVSSPSRDNRIRADIAIFGFQDRVAAARRLDEMCRLHGLVSDDDTPWERRSYWLDISPTCLWSRE